MSETRSGVFCAVVTRDAAAAARDGCVFFEANLLNERTPQPEGELWEIQFADGIWMLARTPDLIFAQ